MTPAEQRLIDAARARAFARVVYAKAADLNQTAHDDKNDVYQRAKEAADKAYQAIIKNELGLRVKATEDALRTASGDWKVWDDEYKAALQALTEWPE